MHQSMYKIIVYGICELKTKINNKTKSYYKMTLQNFANHNLLIANKKNLLECC